MATENEKGIRLGFYSKALKDDNAPLALVGVEGREAISTLFEFDLVLHRAGPPLEETQLCALVSDPCVIAMGPRKSDIVHGILASIEHVGGEHERGNRYVAKLVPHVALLDRGRRSAIYQHTTIPDMISQILVSYGLVRDKTFFLHVAEAAKSPKHEYVVQYNESDWRFIERWLEREGFRYWFRHTAEGVSLVMADTNADASALDDPNKIQFRDRNNLLHDESIWDLHFRIKRVAANVALVDYNDQRPLDILVSTKKVDDGGFGQVMYYGEHFSDKSHGGEWARVRAEELATERKTVSGKSDCPRLRTGHSFELENHSFPAYDGKYLLTTLTHRAGLDPKLDLEDPTNVPTPYRARFEAVPLGVPYRARRKHAWPHIFGVISAHIEADTAGDFAQIDDQGRYKVKFPFDVGTHGGLGASRWIRMAQSYAGAGYGQHMPQHKGTEVLIAHVDGDPDRPLIVGAVPNPVTPSPVVSGNATQSVLQTASGIRVELEDHA